MSDDHSPPPSPFAGGITPEALAAEVQRAVLKARAQALAQGMRHIDLSTDRVDMLIFTAGKEAFAVEARYVREVVPLEELTSVPCTPPFVAGIVNVRGQILSVLDLQVFLRLPTRGFVDRNTVIVLRDEGMEFGVLVVEVQGVRSVAAGEIQTSIRPVSEFADAFLRGVLGDGVVVLDAARLLGESSIIVHETV